MTKLTRAPRRLSPEEITELARDIVTNRKLATDNEHVIKSAFYMILAFVEMTDAYRKNIGAIIGDYNEAVRGRAMNGYPIFYSCQFLHKLDAPALNAEMDRMRAALGIDVSERSEK